MEFLKNPTYIYIKKNAVKKDFVAIGNARGFQRFYESLVFWTISQIWRYQRSRNSLKPRRGSPNPPSSLGRRGQSRHLGYEDPYVPRAETKRNSAKIPGVKRR